MMPCSRQFKRNDKGRYLIHNGVSSSKADTKLETLYCSLAEKRKWHRLVTRVEIEKKILHFIR